MTAAALTRCARCGQEYPSDTLVLTVAGRVCSSCEVDSRSGAGQFRGDLWRILVGPFVTGIGTLTGGLFAFAFGSMLLPVFYVAFGIMGLACAWQAGTWGLWEVLDRESGRPVWGASAMLAALLTLAWAGAMVLVSLLVVAGFARF